MLPNLAPHALIGYEPMATALTDVFIRQSKIPKAGEIWRAENLTLSGLDNVNLHRDLFVRNEMLLLWNEVASVINSPKKISAGIITGSPGVGKSTEVFCQLTYYATTRKVGNRMNCIWISCAVGLVSILVIVNGCAHFTRFLGEPDNNVFTELIYWCINAEIHVIAMDGTWKNQLVFACNIDLVAKNLNRRLAIIICTSQQSVKLSSYMFGKIMPVIFGVAAWEEEDLRSAWDKGLLAISVEREFDEVYFYAGGAIRLYGFDSLNTIQGFLDAKFNQIGDVNLAIRYQSGEACAAAVNTLKCTYRSSNSKESTWISQYVAHNIMEKADASLLKPFYPITKGNNSFRGWVLEADLMRRVVNKKAIKLLGADGMQAFDVSVEHIDRFGTNPPPANVSNLKIGQSLFVIPTEFNNALWDGIVVEKRGDKDFKIVFLQVTCSSEHLFKCEHISKVLTWLFPEVLNTTRKAGMRCGEIWFCTVVEAVDDIRRFTPNFIDVVNVKIFDPKVDVDERSLVCSLFSSRRG
jgi:hypothetical protein